MNQLAFMGKPGGESYFSVLNIRSPSPVKQVVLRR